MCLDASVDGSIEILDEGPSPSIKMIEIVRIFVLTRLFFERRIFHFGEGVDNVVEKLGSFGDRFGILFLLGHGQ